MLKWKVEEYYQDFGLNRGPRFKNHVREISHWVFWFSEVKLLFVFQISFIDLHLQPTFKFLKFNFYFRHIIYECLSYFSEHFEQELKPYGFQARILLIDTDQQAL